MQLRCRRTASHRLPPIGACGCIRDPDVDRHQCHADGPSEVLVDAAAAALTHLDRIGTPGLLDTGTCRALWRRGYRRLSAQCVTRAGWSA